MDKKKIVHQLDTPYSTAKWAIVEAADQDTILELLCTLLAPIGQHRAQNVPISKGKRDRKRKAVSAADEKELQTQPPPPPELLQHVDVGLVAISRNLQDFASASKPIEANSGSSIGAGSTLKSPYAAVFVARSGQPAILNSHLPQMIAVASQNRPDYEPIRLVGISKACEDRLSEALGIPRVSCIALRADAPNGAPLLAFVRDHVSPIKLEWLETSQSGQFQATKINSIPTTIGVKKQPVKT